MTADSLLRWGMMTRDEARGWLTWLAEPPGMSRRVERRRGELGYGGKPNIEPYPFAGMDLETEPSPVGWRHKAPAAAQIAQAFGRPIPEGARAGDLKYQGRVTPFGTPLAQVARLGGEMLVSTCGNCTAPMSRCRCDFTGPTG